MSSALIGALSLSSVTWLVRSDLSLDFTFWKGTRIVSMSLAMVLVTLCYVVSDQGFSQDKPVAYVGRWHLAGAHVM